MTSNFQAKRKKSGFDFIGTTFVLLLEEEVNMNLMHVAGISG